VNFRWTFTFCFEKSYDGTHLAFGGTLDRRCHFKHVSLKQIRFYHCHTIKTLPFFLRLDLCLLTYCRCRWLALHMITLTPTHTHIHTHTDTHIHSVELLRTRDQPVPETFPWQRKHLLETDLNAPVESDPTIPVSEWPQTHVLGFSDQLIHQRKYINVSFMFRNVKQIKTKMFFLRS